MNTASPGPYGPGAAASKKVKGHKFLRKGYTPPSGGPAAAEVLEYQGFRRSFYSPLNKKGRNRLT